MLSTLVFRELRYNGDIKEEISRLKDILNKDHENIKALERLASIYHAYKKNEKAIKIYDKLVELLPDSHEMVAYLGYLYYENDDMINSEKYLNKALDISDGEPFILFLLGNIYARKGMIAEASDCYELALFLDFDMYTAHIDFARKYEHMGRHKKALEEYRAAYDIDPRDDELLKRITYVENRYIELKEKQINI